MHRLGPLLIATVLLASCGRRSSDASTVDTVMVFITRDAKVLANGREVTPPVFDSLLTATQAANGGVWLYQESFEHRVGTRVDSVFKTVAESILSHKLPVWFAHRPDFGDLERKLGKSTP